MMVEREPIADRDRYYNPMLDPYVVAKMTPKMAAAAAKDAYGRNNQTLNEPDDQHPANLISSKCSDGRHRPALDIDIPCELVESATPGHHHLYFPTLSLDWETYQMLLSVLAYVGIIEPAYRNMSIKDGQSLLRPPGYEKVQDPTIPHNPPAPPFPNHRERTYGVEDHPRPRRADTY